MDSTRVVLITGAGGGLGQALTKAFEADGWRVAAAAHRILPPPRPEPFRGFTVELANAVDVARLFAEVDRHFGRLDAVIQAGGLAVDGLLAELNPMEWDQCHEVNLRGAFLCARAALPLLIKQGGGHILQIGSFAARGAVGQAAYAAAKAGLLGFTTALAREVGGTNVRVNTVLPGVLRTGMTAGLSRDRLAALAKANVLGRLNELEEVARFVAHLVSTRNISGQIFQLDSRISRWT